MLLITACILNRYAQAALHLDLRQVEWLFLTCRNYWIVTIEEEEEEDFLPEDDTYDN